MTLLNVRHQYDPVIEFLSADIDLCTGTFTGATLKDGTSGVTSGCEYREIAVAAGSRAQLSNSKAASRMINTQTQSLTVRNNHKVDQSILRWNNNSNFTAGTWSTTNSATLMGSSVTTTHSG